MKANSLLSSLALLDKVIPGKPIDPITGNIEFRPSSEGLVARATSPGIDLSLNLGEIGGLSTEHKPFLIPATVLTKLIRTLGDTETALTFDGSDLAIAAGSFQTHLRAIIAELPPRPDTTAKESQILGRDLASAIQNVVHAAATEDYRGVFTGIELGRTWQDFWAVATDGFRLAVQRIAQVENTEFKVLIPAGSVPVLLKFLALAAPDEMVSLRPDRNGIRVDTTAGSIWVAARDGLLPEWRQLVLAEPLEILNIEGDVLRKALERALVLADSENRRIDFVLGDGYVTVSTKTGSAQSTETVPAMGSRGSAESVLSINGEYLRAALAVIDGPATLGLSGPLAPVRIKSESNPGYTAVLVPLKV